MAQKIITDGIYRQKYNEKQFEVRIYRWKNPKTKQVENVALVPGFVKEPMENWNLIEKIKKGDKVKYQLTLLKNNVCRKKSRSTMLQHIGLSI